MCAFIRMFLFVLLLFILQHFAYCNGSACCKSIPDTESGCQGACFQLSGANSQLDQLAVLSSAQNHCQHYQDQFWSCAETLIPVLDELDAFSGRLCCNLTKTRACREACLRAQSERDLDRHCSRSTEDQKLYKCIARQKDGEKCCGRAADSLACKVSCWNMYLADKLTSSENRRHLRQVCKNKDVVQCLQKQTRLTRQSSHVDSQRCCQQTNNSTCKMGCLEALRSTGNTDEKLDRVFAACGDPDITLPLWQCLLKKDSHDPTPVAGLDAAKLHCCGKASSKRCGQLCVKTHAHKWSSIHKFEESCGYLSSPVSNEHEPHMHGCLKEVDEPCQLGCGGLSYCTNMNKRPTEHFRSCNRESDLAAQNDILNWQKGLIKLPSMTIPVKDIRTCEPEMWKAIACAYQIKPCYKKRSPPQICQEDCVYILNRCVDHTKLNGKRVTDLCNRLPVTSSGECISVKQYTAESPHKAIAQEVTQPCRPNPCQKDEVCHIHRRKCHHSNQCPHFVCRKGCKMGQVSKVLVPQNTYVLVPVFKDNELNMRCQHQKVCHCSHKGELGNCRNTRCVSKSKCSINSLGRKGHGEYFQSDCNDCMCFGGVEVCTKRQCKSSTSVNSMKWTGIQNCDCGRIYNPVCGANGKTYPSACVATCAGQTHFVKGSCFSIDPCKSSPCQPGLRCVSNRQVCYGSEDRCMQFQCVDTMKCNKHHHEPACDVHGIEYTNHCILLQKGQTLAYRGHCTTTPCSTSGLVCGHNGETYSSECAALGARTSVDYQGTCRTFGLINGGLTRNEVVCGEVECAPVSPSGCQGIVPPWSCCPVCAAELRVLASESAAAEMTRTKQKGTIITVTDILKTLSTMVSVSECDVFGYLGLDGDIIVLVKPISHTPTALQVNACIKEAERFEYRIKSRSPAFSSNVLLTPLLYAPLRTPVMTLNSGGVIHTHSCLVSLTLVVVSFMHVILDYV